MALNLLKVLFGIPDSFIMSGYDQLDLIDSISFRDPPDLKWFKNFHCKVKGNPYLYILELLFRFRNFFHEQQMRSIPA